MAAPLFYLIRRAALKREYGLEFCIFKDLPNTGPIPSIGEPQSQIGADSSSQQADPTIGGEGSWVAVLGLSESASIREVGEAYKELIKQNHPDRVHDMSPAFKTLAESETKKLNAAYRQQQRRAKLNCDVAREPNEWTTWMGALKQNPSTPAAVKA